jgi:hypothetical protein
MAGIKVRGHRRRRQTLGRLLPRPRDVRTVSANGAPKASEGQRSLAETQCRSDLLLYAQSGSHVDEV